MNTSTWKLLSKIIESGSMSAVAVQTNYTVSGISRMISALEEDVGFPLLIRTNRGAVPTKECELLLSDVRYLMYIEEQITQKIALLKGLEIGTLIIGTAYSFCYSILTQQMVRFVKQYPNMTYKMLWGYSADLCRDVAERRIDACIVNNPDKSLKRYLYREEPVVAIVSARSKYSGEEVFPLSAAANEPYIDISPDTGIDSARILKQNNVKPMTRFTVSDRYAAHEMAAANLGIALISKSMVIPRNDVVVLPLNPPQKIKMYLACHQNPSLAAVRFIEFMNQYN